MIRLAISGGVASSAPLTSQAANASVTRVSCFGSIPCRSCSAGGLDGVLLEQRDISDAKDDLCASAAQLVQRGGKLSDVGRLAHEDRRNAGSESDPLGAMRGGREQKPRVLEVDFVGAVAPVVAEPIRERNRIQKLGYRLLGEHLEAEQHARQRNPPHQRRAGPAY